MTAECYIPQVVYRRRWGRESLAISDLGGGSFGVVCIGPESDVDSVELRPNGLNDPTSRIIVSKERPYVGYLEGKSLSIVPTVVHGEADTAWDHSMQLYMYPTAISPLPDKRAPKRFDWMIHGDAGNSVNTHTARFPLLPCIGRRFARIGYAIDCGDLATYTITMTITGYNRGGRASVGQTDADGGSGFGDGDELERLGLVGAGVGPNVGDLQMGNGDIFTAPIVTSTYVQEIVPDGASVTHTESTDGANSIVRRSYDVELPADYYRIAFDSSAAPANRPDWYAVRAMLLD